MSDTLAAARDRIADHRLNLAEFAYNRSVAQTLAERQHWQEMAAAADQCWAEEQGMLDLHLAPAVDEVLGRVQERQRLVRAGRLALELERRGCRLSVDAGRLRLTGRVPRGLEDQIVELRSELFELAQER